MIENISTTIDNQPTILYEDNHIVVALKPQNVPTQADDSGDIDFLNIIKNYIKVKYQKPGNTYIGLVHRLDRPTGGVMVFARTSKAAGRLSEQIRQGDISKKYIAGVVGVPKYSANRLVNYLKKDEKNNIVTLATMLEEGAKKAILDYKVLESNVDTTPPISLVDITLHTGRSHQIRVQMQALGHPLFGDTKYTNAQSETIKSKKLALWAYELGFVHPVTQEKLKFVSYPPNDILPWNHFNIDKYNSIYKPTDN